MKHPILYAFGYALGRLARPLVKSVPDDLEAVARVAGVLSDARAADPIADYLPLPADVREWAGMPLDEDPEAVRQAFADFDAAYDNPELTDQSLADQLAEWSKK